MRALLPRAGLTPEHSCSPQKQSMHMTSVLLELHAISARQQGVLAAHGTLLQEPGELHLHHAEELQHWSYALLRIHRLVVVQVQHLPCSPARLLSELQALLQAQVMFKEARQLASIPLLVAGQCKCC